MCVCVCVCERERELKSGAAAVGTGSGLGCHGVAILGCRAAVSSKRAARADGQTEASQPPCVCVCKCVCVCECVCVCQCVCVCVCLQTNVPWATVCFIFLLDLS